MNETEQQPILDLTQDQKSEVTPKTYMDVNMDFTDFDLGLGF